MNPPYPNDGNRGMRHVQARGTAQYGSNQGHMQQPRGLRRSPTAYQGKNDTFDQNVPFTPDHKSRGNRPRPRQGVPWQPSLEDLHENVRPSPPRGRSTKPVIGRGLAAHGQRDNREKPSLRHAPVAQRTPAKPVPTHQTPQARVTAQKEKRRPISSWFITKTIDDKQFTANAPPFTYAAPLYTGTTDDKSPQNPPFTSRTTTTRTSTVDRSKLPTAPMDIAPRSYFDDGPDEKQKKYSPELSDVSESVARTRRSRRRKRRLDVVGIIFSFLLLLGTIGAYVYYLYKSRFWVSDVEAERQHRPKMLLPQWAHGVAVGGIIASLVAVIAFCTHRKHA